MDPDWLERYPPGPADAAGDAPPAPEGMMRVDLHGLVRSRVRPVLDRALKQALESGCATLLVIHGKGRNSPRDGVLGKEAREYLGAHPLAGSIAQAPPRLGGQGALIVRVRLRKK